MFSLHLGDIEIRDMEAIVLLYPFPNLVIGSLALRSGHIHFVHIDCHFDVLMGFIEFGQKAYRLDVPGDVAMNVNGKAELIMIKFVIPNKSIN